MELFESFEVVQRVYYVIFNILDLRQIMIKKNVYLFVRVLMEGLFLNIIIWLVRYVVIMKLCFIMKLVFLVCRMNLKYIEKVKLKLKK